MPAKDLHHNTLRILLNATTLVKGGAIQVAVELLNQIEIDPMEIEWLPVISTAVKNSAVGRDISLVNSARELTESPAVSRDARKQLLSIESEFEPDAVFTVFGPAFVRFRAPHLTGVANGWVTHAGIDAYRCLKFPHQWIRTFLATRAKGLSYRRANRWVVEAECARVGLSRSFRIPYDQIDVVGNTCAAHYLNATQKALSIGSDEIRLLTFASAYPHKNLEIIPDVAFALRKAAPTQKFKFVVTLESPCPIFERMKRRASDLQVLDCIENVGPIPASEGPNLYATCHICFMPTLLETFTATYPEAMSMDMPIVTSDRDFARDLCQDAALYFPPRDSAAAASQILKLVNSPELRNKLIENGRLRLSTFPTPQQKYHQYVDILRRLVASNKSL